MFLFPAGPHKSRLGPAPSFCCEVKVSPAPIGLGHPSVRWVHAQFPGRSGEVASVGRGGGRDGACGGEAVGACTLGVTCSLPSLLLALTQEAGRTWLEAVERRGCTFSETF